MYKIVGLGIDGVWSQREISKERRQPYLTFDNAVEEKKKELSEYGWLDECLRVIEL